MRAKLLKRRNILYEKLSNYHFGRFRVCAAGPPGDGSVVHVLGGTLRAAQRAHQQQPGILEMGPDFQRPDDDDGGDRPVGASRADLGV